MQVQRIQKYNINFGAKFKFEGALKDMPKEYAGKFQEVVKKIGTDSDIVYIHICNEGKKMGKSGNDGKLYRNGNVASYINANLIQDKITTGDCYGYENTAEKLGNLILDYLIKLV